MNSHHCSDTDSSTIAPENKRTGFSPVPAPDDAQARRQARPAICYELNSLPSLDVSFYQRVRGDSKPLAEYTVPARDGLAVEVAAGQLFRIVCVEGSQVGDLNLWSAHDLDERFYSGKTRQLQSSHLTTGDRLWSSFPGLRPMATIIHDTLGWYGRDADGARVHDVIGTRCDPYTYRMLTGGEFHRCCHSNLTRALAAARGLFLTAAEKHVHDVMNVFMCTGFSHETGQYFTKASPARPGDYIEFFAEIDLLVGLSACPGGDCSSEKAGTGGAEGTNTPCHPLRIEVRAAAKGALASWQPPARNPYSRDHGDSKLI